MGLEPFEFIDISSGTWFSKIKIIVPVGSGFLKIKGIGSK